MKWVLTAVLALALAGPSALGDAAATAPATAPATQAAIVDVKNTRCVVSPDDDVVPEWTSVYQGKLYHFCCKGCKGEFDLHPDKYVKALEADPAKYGVKP